MAQFEIKKATNGEFYFHLQSTGNNKIILSSERYTTKAACENGIDSVKENAPKDARYDKLTSRNSQYYFNLKAGNGQIIGTSEMYATSTSRDNGIELVKDQAPTAGVTDLS